MENLKQFEIEKIKLEHEMQLLKLKKHNLQLVLDIEKLNKDILELKIFIAQYQNDNYLLEFESNKQLVI